MVRTEDSSLETLWEGHGGCGIIGVAYLLMDEEIEHMRKRHDSVTFHGWLGVHMMLYNYYKVGVASY